MIRVEEQDSNDTRRRAKIFEDVHRAKRWEASATRNDGEASDCCNLFLLE